MKTYNMNWCPSDEHGDHEIKLTYTIHHGRPARLYGPDPYPEELDEIEIISATEGGIELNLAKHELDMAIETILNWHPWEDE